MTSSLCCVINPIETCWRCSTKLCNEHSLYRAADKYWCEACLSLDEDSFNLIRSMQERIEDAANCFDDLKCELEEIADHPSRCKTCYNDEYCDTLQSLTASADKSIRKKWMHKTF